MTNPNGRFGIHGGQYIPETLMNAVIELEEAYNRFKDDENTLPHYHYHNSLRIRSRSCISHRLPYVR